MTLSHICSCRSSHLSILPSHLTQGAVLSSQPLPPGIKEWVVLGQPGGLLGRDMDLAGVEPWGIQGEAAVVRGTASMRDSNGTQRWECGGQKCVCGDREVAMGTSGTMWIETVHWGESGPRWQRWSCGHHTWDWSRGDMTVRDGGQWGLGIRNGTRDQKFNVV